MSGTAIWVLVLLGLAVVVVRRRSVAVALVTGQALVLAGLAASRAGTGEELAASVALAVRAVALAALFLALIARSREGRPVRVAVTPGARAGLAVGLALLLIWLVPLGGGPVRDASEGTLAMLAFGLTTCATRRPILFQAMGIVGVENALALAALSLGGGSSLAIELGVTLDLSLVAVVAAVFHQRIFSEFGSGDSGALRSLRD